MCFCAHVLEHVWDVKVALENISNLCKADGYVWLNVPSSTIAHGSPEYYSAGYQPDLLFKLLEPHGFELVDAGILGSHREYIYHHLFNRWPDESEHDFPLIYGPGGRGGIVRAVLRWVKYFPQRLIALFFSSKTIHDPLLSTQTWVLAKKLM